MSRWAVHSPRRWTPPRHHRLWRPLRQHPVRVAPQGQLRSPARLLLPLHRHRPRRGRALEVPALVVALVEVVVVGRPRLLLHKEAPLQMAARLRVPVRQDLKSRVQPTASPQAIASQGAITIPQATARPLATANPARQVAIQARAVQTPVPGWQPVAVPRQRQPALPEASR